MAKRGSNDTGRPAIGDCIYCKRPAGFLRRSHRECKQAHDLGVRRIEKLVRRRDLAPGEAAGQIVRIARKARVSHALKPALVSGWASAVSAALAQGGVDNAEEARLDSLLAHFDISRNKIDRGKLWRKVQAKRAQVAGERVERLIDEAIHTGERSDRSLEEVEAEIEAAARSAGLDDADLRRVVIGAMEKGVESVLEDNLLTAEEESALAAVTGYFDIDQEDLDRNGAYTRLVQAGILRDLVEGKVPQRMRLASRALPFRLQKTETLIWVFQHVDYYTVRTRREYRGRSAGVSVRVARGVYFRTGGFKGHPVDYDETVHVDTGLLGVTTRHIYFAGVSKRFRVRHDRIVTIEPYSDGVGIMRDSVRARPETFRVGDGWFAYNLLRNIELP